ncbi:hypothetical protein [Pseudomonas sp. zfem003]|uniref:hypothetical protein n=1 Tax=Pseudomonas sp. zfem003 TaxID=3078198 RepID=UPI002928F1F0|nr:hypothetical protein [Pseudomonas sp. zfem003]MDU9395418.1 hypothetical protein [Pseudomonas sp. zfem003]
MVEDIQNGAILPPIVLGILTEPSEIEKIRQFSDYSEFFRFLDEVDIDRISIIDGMQRTTAILDAFKSGNLPNLSQTRVEFWIAENVNSLIYRMLVLNTGQVPWDIGRQLETIYYQLLIQIKNKLGDEIKIFLADSKKRRAQPGQYQSKIIVELFLLFSSRKSEIEIKDKISEDFVRLDAIEASASNDSLDYFITTLSLMIKLDKSFSRLSTSAQSNDVDSDRISNGKDIFKSFPAMAGFCAACAIFILDEPGFQRTSMEAKAKQVELDSAISNFCLKLEKLSLEELRKFLEIELLNQKLLQRSTQVGRFEREFFKKAFASLIRNHERLTDLGPCWMAH